jgi:hypothetical protein
MQDKDKLTFKGKIKSILTSAGLGALLGVVMAIMNAGSMGSLDDPNTYIGSLIGGALSGIAMGAAATDGYTRKSVVAEVDDLDVKDQILNIIKLGKQIQ